MSTRRRVTSRQVAEKAGVSQTTVSFVLNNVKSANISEETRQRVNEVARALGYVPNASAQSLARGRSSNIALVIGQAHEQFLIDEYMPAVLTGLSQVIRERGFRLLVEFIEHGNQPDSFLELVQSGEVAGTILSLYSPTQEDIEAVVGLVEEGFPILSIGRLHSKICSIRLDRMQGIRQVVQHLIDLGHRRIACITYAPQPLNRHNQRRLQTYRETLEKAGIAYDDSLVRYGAYDPQTGYTAMKSLLDDGADITAVYAMNDVMAFGAIRAIQERGLSVPGDISVVGYDDIRLARYSNPPLTTVREPAVEHGRLAGDTLMDLIDSASPAEFHQIIPTELVVRESSSIPNAG